MNVANSFITGGSGYSAPGYSSTYDIQNQYELQNYTSIAHGAHTMKFGARVRANVVDDYAPKNFNGLYVFQGTTDLSSLDSGWPKTVIRGGWGIFYDRFPVIGVLTAYRYNGTNQLNYVLYNPTIFDSSFSTALPLSALTLTNSQQRYQIDSHLHAPALMQTVVSVERQLLGRTTLSVNYMNSRGTHLLRTVDINAPLPGTYDFGAVSTVTSSVGIRPYGNVGDIYNYESTGIFKQTQLIVSVNSSIGKWDSLFSRYVYGQAHSDTDDLSTLPANQYDFSGEYGRSALDMRHMLFLGGSFGAPWGIRVSLFFVAHSGIPFNITTGTDLYLTGQAAATARPRVVNGPGENVVDTPYGYLNTVPVAGQAILARNAGNGPGFLELNLRMSKTWGFGTTKFQGESGGSTVRAVEDRAADLRVGAQAVHSDWIHQQNTASISRSPSWRGIS